MPTKVEQTIKKTIWPGKVIVAVSGGLDSVVLLDAIRRFCPVVEIVVAHVNYQLRGDASDQDQTFVTNLCQEYQVPLCLKKVHPPKNSGVEDWARQVRYRFFADLAEKSSAKAVTLAQHQDDQVETLLLQLVRGGLAQKKVGMLQSDNYYLRPFLTIEKQDLREYAQKYGLSWREDLTNADPTYTGRNTLRHRVLPVLTDLNQRAKDHLVDFASQWAADQELLKEQASAYLTAFEKDFSRVPSSWWQKTLILWLQKQGLYRIKDRQVKTILSLLANRQKPQGQVTLGDGYFFVKSYQEVQLLKVRKKEKNDRKPAKLVLKLDQWQFFDQGQLLWTNCQPAEDVPAVVLPDDLSDELILSLAKKDDRIPLKEGTKSVRRLLIDQKIPISLRSKTWLLQDQSQKILAVWLGQKTWYFPAGADRPQVAKQWLVWRIEGN